MSVMHMDERTGEQPVDRRDVLRSVRGSSLDRFSDGDGSPLEEYADERGIVTTDGLETAVDDWSSGEVSTGFLQRVVAAWSSGDPVD